MVGWVGGLMGLCISLCVAMSLMLYLFCQLGGCEFGIVGNGVAEVSAEFDGESSVDRHERETKPLVNPSEKS